jgi:hypothetical protein
MQESLLQHRNEEMDWLELKRSQAVVVTKDIVMDLVAIALVGLSLA